MIRAALALLPVLGAAVVLTGTAAAQSFTGQSAELQLAPLARAGPAIWVNPAGLASRDASIEGHLTLRRDSAVDFANAGLAIITNGLAFGYQRDRRGDGGSGAAYALALGLGDPVFSLGISRRWYKSSGVLTGTWDVGTNWRPAPPFTLTLVWRDAGSPRMRDTAVSAVLIPGAAARFGAAALAAEWELVTKGLGTSAVRAGGQLVLGRFTIGIRGSFSGEARSRSVALQVLWTGLGVSSGAYAVAGGPGAPDQAGLTGALITRPLEQGRWR
ncbi:MAG TPA: hypothetical protein VNL98_11285 [Gemmatimonadales bacterium]|nr:hypothetical protein [Gemmatimonadales bacterium]